MIDQHSDYKFQSLLARVLCAEDPLMLSLEIPGVTSTLSQEHVFVMGPGGKIEYFKASSARLVAQGHGADEEVLEHIDQTGDVPTILLFTEDHPQLRAMASDGIVNLYPVEHLLRDIMSRGSKPMQNILMFTENRIIYRSAQEIFDRLQRSQGRMDEWPPPSPEERAMRPTVNFPHALLPEQIEVINTILLQQTWIRGVAIHQVEVHGNLIHALSVEPEPSPGKTWNTEAMAEKGLPLIDAIKAVTGIDVLLNTTPLSQSEGRTIPMPTIDPPGL